MSENATLDRLEAQREKIQSGGGKVAPGEPMNLSPALASDQCVAQGDLYLRILESVPENYRKVPTQTQLVPSLGDNTVGSKHCLDGTEGVEMFLPPDWSDSYEGLDGPVLKLDKGVSRTVTHPVHGDVHLPDDSIVECFYQRNYDEDLQRERRARD